VFGFQPFGYGLFATTGDSGNTPVAAQWSPSDKSSGVTLSNGNRTADIPTGFNSVRANNSGLGKFYFEVSVDLGPAGFNVGVADAIAPFTNWVGDSGVTDGASVQADGSLHAGGGVGTGFAYTTGDVIGVSVDVPNKLVYFKKNNVNQIGGDPVAGTGGVSLSATTGPIYPVFQGNSGHETATGRFTAASQSYAPPSGFTALDTAGAGGAAVARSDESDTSPALSGKQIRAVGITLESDTALALSAKAILAAGLATETDVALQVAARAIRATGLATESDTALPLGVARPVGLSPETDSGLAPARAQVRTTAASLETDNALPLGSARPNGLATEADSAIALNGLALRPVGISSEADAPLTLAGRAARVPGLALEADTASALSVVALRAVGLSTEADTGLALARRSVLGVSRTDETNTAFALLSGGAALPIGIGAETDTVLPLVGKQVASTGAAVEIDATIGLGIAARLTAANENETALSMARLAIAATGAANDNESAMALDGLLPLAIGAASESDTAFQLERFVLHPPVDTPADRRASGELAARNVAGTAQCRSASGSAQDRTATGALEDRSAVGNLQPRRSAA
jgi:hypothetical protein